MLLIEDGSDVPDDYHPHSIPLLFVVQRQRNAVDELKFYQTTCDDKHVLSNELVLVRVWEGLLTSSGDDNGKAKPTKTKASTVQIGILGGREREREALVGSRRWRRSALSRAFVASAAYHRCVR